MEPSDRCSFAKLDGDGEGLEVEVIDPESLLQETYTPWVPNMVT